jgi:hypothetical protein
MLVLTAAAPAAATDAFVCYKTRASSGASTFPGATVPVTDELGTRSLDVKKPRHLCVPADLGGGISDPAVSLRGYKARPTRGSAPYEAESAVQVLGPFGEHWLDRKAKPKLLLVPAATDPAVPPSVPDPGAHDVDHFRCHRARPSAAGPALPAGTEVTVGDALTEPRRFAVRKPAHLCDPVDALGLPIEHPATALACYTLGRLPNEPRHAGAAGLYVATYLGADQLDTAKEVELCVPSRAIARCNGHAAFCDRPFDGVSYATAHNAMSNAEEGWLAPNQTFGVTRQLDDGIRALMLDTWYFGGDAVLCHGGDLFPCDLTGMKPLVDGLAEIKDFLDRRPNEVVSIIFESYVSEADTEADFIASGLLPLTHVQSAAEPWPSLRELLAADTRLVVFTDDGGASLPWHHYVWDHAWETHFSAQAPGVFSCAKNRGSFSNSLFILNHFLTKPFALPSLAEMVNHDPFFVERALQCQAESGFLPNFVTVDFHDIGDVFDVVDVLNGVAP